MGSFDFSELVFRDRKNVRRQVLFQNALVILDRRIFTTFAFRNNCGVTSSSHDRLDVHPAAMKRSRNSAGLCRTATELPHFRLEFGRKLRSLYRALAK